MMSFKPGSMPHLMWSMAAALVIVERIMAARGVALIITAGVDGCHMRGSKHYEGLAFDCRSKDLPVGERVAVLEAIKRSLGPAYDALMENAGTDNEHYHVEFDPDIGTYNVRNPHCV